MTSHPEGKSLIEVARQFEVDVMLLVTMNHDIILEAITQKEKESLAQLMSDPTAVGYVEVIYRGLRRSANNLAIVALVTRLDHWIRKLRSRIRDEKEKGPRESVLVRNLRTLNNSLGDGAPVTVEFFQELETVRDSIIHNDSKTEWKREVRRVAECYSNYFGGEVEIKEVQVKEAAAKAIEQVKWYDERLQARDL